MTLLGKEPLSLILADMLYLHRGGFSTLILIAVLFLGPTCHPGNASAETDPSPIKVDINSVDIQITDRVSSQSVSIFLEASPNQYYGAAVPADHYDIKGVKPNIYHLRNNRWKDVIWKIDVETKSVYRVTGGSFGLPGGYETRLNRILVNDMPAIPQMNSPRNVRLHLGVCVMRLDPGKDTVRLAFEDDELSGSNDWKMLRVKPNVFHLKFIPLNGFPIFWMIDLNEMKAAGIKDGVFGSIGGKASPLSWSVHAQTSQPAGSTDTIAEDLMMKRVSGNPPKSDWFEAEKRLNRNLLKQGTYDILVVPFQVQGYAIDRIGRSLMTRYFTHRIETVSNAKVPSPTLVAKAFGELSRTIPDADAFQLANELGVTKLIRGYVGHNRGGKMNVTFIIQSRGAHDVFSEATKAAILEWKAIPFTDEQPPSDVFLAMLDNIMSKMPFKQANKIKVDAYKKETQLALPQTITDMSGKTKTTPVLNAYYLQLLGALYPEQTAEKESFFERSLVALTEVSPKSPDYALIKARAYYNLNRRPAALAAMPSPEIAEEKAFTALLNGDMIALEKLVHEITRPIPRLLAQIELNDLRWKYDNKQEARKSYADITRDIPDWELLVARRLKSNDVWEVQSNMPVKQALDDLFPISDFTAKSIVRGKVALGETLSDSDDIDLSVYDHYRRLLENQGQQFSLNESGHVVKRDALYLLAAIGESNVLNKIRMRIFTQSSLQEGLDLLDRYETLYRGQPEFAYLRANVLKKLSATKQGQVRDNLDKSAKDAAYNACYWFQGQTMSASKTCDAYEMYDGDYPRRWFWNWNFNGYKPGDRSIEFYNLNFSSDSTFTKLGATEKDHLKNLDIALRYTSMDFQPFESYHRELLRVGLDAEADALVKANRHRFSGSPQWSVFIMSLKDNKGDDSQVNRKYEEAIASAPNAWEPYEKLGDSYITQGDFAKAATCYNRYPLFHPGKVSPSDDSETVTLSNYAYRAGFHLWWHGAIQESIPFFRQSAGYQTGSGAGMESAVILSLLDGDYLQAAQQLREKAARYQQGKTYDRYASLLQVLGFHEEAWSVYINRDLVKGLGYHKQTPFIGHRLEGKPEDEQLQWLWAKGNKKISCQDFQEYILFTNLTDRPLNEKLPGIIEDIGKQIGYDGMEGPPEMRSALVDFSKIHNNLRMGHYSQAYAIYNSMFTHDNYQSYWFVLPYGAWSSVKNGTAPAFETFLNNYRTTNGETSYYHLAQAYLKGGSKKYAESIAHLKAAQYNLSLPNDVESRPLFIWYQVVETCEWLYKDTGYDGYRDLLLTFTKLCQSICPTYAWAYAAEAKYTTSETDRTRALGITLYLDKRSDRISKISDREKKKALKWLENNNPFLRARTNSNKSDI